MKKLIFALLCLLLLESAAHAQNWRRVESKAPPATVGDEVRVTYLTGLPEIDATTNCYAYNVRLVFEQSDLVLKRNMIDQKKGRGVEEVEVARIPYASIKELHYGYDTAYAAQEEKLATAQKQYCNNQKMIMALQILKSPVAILFEREKKPISFVVAAPDDDAVRLYRGLAERAKVKAKTPLAYKGVVKQRAKLDPPPAEGER